jgi:hypothetical protein
MLARKNIHETTISVYQRVVVAVGVHINDDAIMPRRQKMQRNQDSLLSVASWC